LLGAGACVAVAGAVQSTQGAVALMSVSLFFLYVTGAIYWADDPHVDAADHAPLLLQQPALRVERPLRLRPVQLRERAERR
ncbi:hypothetical protein SB764_43795, partial [Paraburkholderia sp. SIMBA_027]